MEESENKQSRTIGLRFLLGWGIGMLLIVAGIVELFSSPIEGVVTLLAGIVVFTPFWDLVKQKANFGLSGTLKVILFLVLIGIGGGLAGKSLSGSNGSVPAVPDKTSGTTRATLANTPVPTQIPAPQVLLDLKGNGTKTTQKFTAGGDWDLNWTYDCSNFSLGSGNFAVLIYNGDGTMSLGNGAVNQLGSKGADVEHYHVGGTYYLQVSSECGWSIKVNG